MQVFNGLSFVGNSNDLFLSVYQQPAYTHLVLAVTKKEALHETFPLSEFPSNGHDTHRPSRHFRSQQNTPQSFFLQLEHVCLIVEADDLYRPATAEVTHPDCSKRIRKYDLI